MTAQTANYFALGSKVAYVVQRTPVDEMGVVTGKSEIHSGEGVIVSIHLDPEQRQMVRVMDKDKAVNVEYAMVNPSEEQVEAYKCLCLAISEATDAANAKVSEMIAEENQAITALRNPLLGMPVEMATDAITTETVN